MSRVGNDALLRVSSESPHFGHSPGGNSIMESASDLGAWIFDHPHFGQVILKGNGFTGISHLSVDVDFPYYSILSFACVK